MPRPIQSIKQIPRLPWGMLPQTLRLLLVSEEDQMAIWLRNAFSSDAACAMQLDVVTNPIFALEQLETQTFDVVVVSHHGPETLEWVEVIRRSVRDQPIQVLGKSADREFSALCFEAGADGFLTIDAMTIREMLWHLSRSAERRTLLKESEALKSLHQRYENDSHQDVLSHLAEQQIILDVMGVEADDDKQQWIDQQLSQIAAAHLQGGANLYEALEQFVRNMSERDVMIAQVVKSIFRSLHSAVLELGPSNSRRVVDRSYVLMLEIISKMEARRARDMTSEKVVDKKAA